MAQKLNMQSPDLANEKFAQLAALFPNAVTETLDENGRPVRSIDKDILSQEIATYVVEGREERYQFTWPDKREAIRMANTPSTQCLRPCREESVDFDNTQNLYIEGDNLEVLKVLHETYLGKVKMIYIDPPYNTGNDFVYNDDFAESTEAFKERDGQKDEQGNRLFKNSDSNGRFHTDWLNMMYPRLKVARDLLSDDGIIFISIDDNEVDNLKKVCNEIFGERNFVAQIIWERAYAPINLMKHFSTSHDYILCYAKNIDLLVCNGIPRSLAANERYSNPDNDPRGVWKPSDLSVGPAVIENIYPITTPSGRVVEPPAGRSLRLSKKAFLESLNDNRIWFGSQGNSVPSMKRFLSELRKTGLTPMTIWKYSDVGHSQEATQRLQELFDGKKLFDYPKPIDLIKRIVSIYSLSDSLILDFFSGSATTAHAVMKLNSEDGGHRKFIMVQLPELTDEKSEAYKAGYKNICEIGKERIRRAGKKVKEEAGLAGQNLDIGFRVLKLDSSNMADVYYTPQESEQRTLFDENVKPDRSNEDLLFQVMLDLGVELSAKIEVKQIAGKTVHFVDENYLVACFDREINDSTIKEIAKLQPVYFVMRDSSAANDNVIDNFEQIFKHYSPDTNCRIL